MYIKKLTLKGFRNYENAELEFSPLTNMIYGNNAQGKTNILEAVYLFAQGRSHRAKTDKELVRFGDEFARLSIDFADAQRSYNGQMQIMKNGRKAVSVNHVHITKLSRLMNYLNVVMFSPEDLNIVKGSPNVRRRFIDSSLSQLYPSYMSALMEYNKVLNQKNSLLKMLRSGGRASDPTLSVWNEQLAETGARIMSARIEFVRCINESARTIQSEISGEHLKIVYHPSFKLEDIGKNMIYDYLEQRSRREVEMGSAQYGIQRDDLEIFVNDREAKLFGSQGQQRTAALSMKIAQSEYIKEIKGEYPVLLLDDIMSELDINRRMYLSERIRDKQVLITSTDTDLTDEMTDTKLFHIDNGTVI
ncbi:MAG: DNA replication/repair protein RecF [Clostridiales bacterium]|nr:DNA replication/repair protein RecF [Clostridiales bacterium]